MAKLACAAVLGCRGRPLLPSQQGGAAGKSARVAGGGTATAAAPAPSAEALLSLAAAVPAGQSAAELVDTSSDDSDVPLAQSRARAARMPHQARRPRPAAVLLAGGGSGRGRAATGSAGPGVVNDDGKATRLLALINADPGARMSPTISSDLATLLKARGTAKLASEATRRGRRGPPLRKQLRSSADLKPPSLMRGTSEMMGGRLLKDIHDTKLGSNGCGGADASDSGSDSETPFAQLQAPRGACNPTPARWPRPAAAPAADGGGGKDRAASGGAGPGMDDDDREATRLLALINAEAGPGARMSQTVTWKLASLLMRAAAAARLEVEAPLGGRFEPPLPRQPAGAAAPLGARAAGEGTTCHRQQRASNAGWDADSSDLEDEVARKYPKNAK